MNRRTTYYVEVYKINNRPHLRFHRTFLKKEHLSEATIAVYMVRDCATQEEAVAALLAASSKEGARVPWNALDNNITRVI
jgi:hypothetical protein